MKKLLVFFLLPACSPPILEHEINKVANQAKKEMPELFSEDGMKITFQISELHNDFTGWSVCKDTSCIISIDPKVERNYEFLENVVMHELGHALGLKHVADWNNVMNTFSVSQITMSEMVAQIKEACKTIECRKLSF